MAKTCPSCMGPHEGFLVLQDAAGLGRPEDDPALDGADTGDLRPVSTSLCLVAPFCKMDNSGLPPPSVYMILYCSQSIFPEILCL